MHDLTGLSVFPYPNASTIVCVASGPSLTPADLQRLTDCRIIAVSNAAFVVPWADAVYSAEVKWWQWHEQLALEGTVPMFTVSAIAPRRYPKLRQLLVSGAHGLDFREGWVRTGGHSGFTALNLAVHLGAKRIVLLGYDMMPDPTTGAQHFFGDHPDRSHLRYHRHLDVYRALRPLLEPKGITLLNASRRTAIPAAYIPRVSVEELFPAGVQAV